MSLFEFLMVLVSIIIGLGLAEILQGIAQLIRARAEVRYYWVHGAVTGVVFVVLIQQWWEAWELRTLPTWSFPALGGLLLGPILFFLIAHLLFPDEPRGADMEEYYYGAMRPAWILAGIGIIGSTSFRPIFLGTDLISPGNLASLIALLGCAALYLSSNRRFHSIVMPALFVLTVYDVLRYTPEIGG